MMTADLIGAVPKLFAKKVIESLQGTVSIYILHSLKYNFLS